MKVFKVNGISIDHATIVTCRAIRHALKWAKARGYKVPMQEVLDGMA